MTQLIIKIRQCLEARDSKRLHRAGAVRPLSSRFLVPPMTVFLLCCGVAPIWADSGTWLLNPANGDWNNSANWTSPTPPNGPFDTATFGVSNLTSVSISEDTSIFSMVFNAGASAYHFTCPPSRHFTILDGGIDNGSGVIQTFDVLAADTADNFTSLAFGFHSSAGTNTLVIAHGAAVGNGANPGFTQFTTADAGSATLINNGGVVSGAKGGEIDFFNSSQAATATITNRAGTADGALGGRTLFWDGSGADSVITAEGATVGGGEGGITLLLGNSDAGDATMIAEGGSNGGGGGAIEFQDKGAGGTASIEVFGNGHLDISALAISAITIGSLEGDGQVFLGNRKLNIGANNLSTTFSGAIQDSGSLSKLGTGTLTLSGANTYSGATTVSAGALKVANRTGSATGTGEIKVNAGTLGGKDIIAGAVTAGTGSGAGAFLAPSVGAGQPAKLTIQSPLTFKADGTLHLQAQHQESQSRSGGGQWRDDRQRRAV